ncbi:MAG TPA: PEP/pyruvate-binding domain-containing protein [Thermodesulfobacteriota bacterium]|nr:PEP/pyruvate-binding domain-containing protein [Thermodesulfobacteriota bacterium]
MDTSTIPSGIQALDEVLQGIRLGDNVVWQVDCLEDYCFFAEPFAKAAVAAHRSIVYLRFASHPPVLAPQSGIETFELNPSLGFDLFTREVHRLIETRGPGVLYLFDNLSALVAEWATDELLANFFQITCPFLFELHTIAYFALTRGQHAHSTVARIRDTTQILVNVYHAKGQMHIHPIKVWDRYSPQMFLPHLVAGENWSPLSDSHEAAAVLALARQSPSLGTTRPLAPWESVYQKLVHYGDTATGFDETNPEQLALKQELGRMLIGHHPIFGRLGDQYFTLDDLFAIRNRLIGAGRIGGKAAGMLLSRRILLNEKDETGIDFAERLEDHDSFYIGSDVFFTFLVNNDLFRLRLQLTRDSAISEEEFEEVEERFLAGHFSPAIQEQFRAMLDYFGQAPIIVRSSSLLEDSFGNAFAGKYRSEFCANQGTPEARLTDFMRAVKLVYASALNPNALSYRRKRGLGENDEQMAILVQRVSGMAYRQYFFPSLAGVAFSRNLYAWNDRIDSQQGIIRLVFGLGTRAVDRVGSDYPRMIAISHPHLRPEVGAEVSKYSQRQVDLLDIEANQFNSHFLADILAHGDYPNLSLFVSVMQDHHPYDPISARVEGNVNQWVLTFNNLIRRTDFVPFIGNILTKLEKAYQQAVDVEFTASVDGHGHVRINLLQCRPLFLPGSTADVSIPTCLECQQILFRAHRMICGGFVERIRYILYINPQRYYRLGSESKKSLGRLVGQINRHPEIQGNTIMMMGPGRWGTSNIALGVNVSYADIDNAAVLVEVALEEAGHVPEVSYGTHFFQDLVEAQIIYLPLYPDDAAAEFQETFFETAPNVLLELLPHAGEYQSVLHLIDVPKTTGGSFAQVMADPQSHHAVCFLDKVITKTSERKS